MLPAKVITEVQIKNNYIHKINILEYENVFGEKITENIIRKQELDVDIASGATVSSKVILKVVDNVLNK